MRNFTKHLVDVILVDQIKVTCKDEHSQMCSKGQGVRGIRFKKKKLQMGRNISVFCKMLLQNQAQTAVLKSYSYAARHKPQSPIQLENTGLHQIRANKELDKSQQASPCLRKQMLKQHITLQHQGEGFLGTFRTWKHFSSHPRLACFGTCASSSGGLNPSQNGIEAASTRDWVSSVLGHCT